MVCFGPGYQIWWRSYVYNYYFHTFLIALPLCCSLLWNSYKKVHGDKLNYLISRYTAMLISRMANVYIFGSVPDVSWKVKAACCRVCLMSKMHFLFHHDSNANLPAGQSLLQNQCENDIKSWVKWSMEVDRRWWVQVAWSSVYSWCLNEIFNNNCRENWRKKEVRKV